MSFFSPPLDYHEEWNYCPPIPDTDCPSDGFWVQLGSSRCFHLRPYGRYVDMGIYELELYADVHADRAVAAEIRRVLRDHVEDVDEEQAA